MPTSILGSDSTVKNNTDSVSAFMKFHSNGENQLAKIDKEITRFLIYWSLCHKLKYTSRLGVGVESSRVLQAKKTMGQRLKVLYLSGLQLSLYYTDK